MKKIAAILMLALLLYNTFGLSIAVLFFKNDFHHATEISDKDEWKLMKFEAPSLPYTSHWQNDEGLSGLIESEGKFYNTTNVLIENDTLYVTLKSNLNARDRFFELAEKMESATRDDQQGPQSPQKILSDLAKIYLNTYSVYWPAGEWAHVPVVKKTAYHHLADFYEPLKKGHLSPPPEA